MVTETIHRCDYCNKVLTYIDADGDQYVKGLSGKKNRDLHAPNGLSVGVHIKSSCGSSHFPIAPLFFEHLCNAHCLRGFIDDWTKDISSHSAWESEVS